MPLSIDVYCFLHFYIVDPLVDHLVKGIAFLEQPNNAKGVLQIVLCLGLNSFQTDYLVLEPYFAIIATQIKEVLIRIQLKQSSSWWGSHGTRKKMSLQVLLRNTFPSQKNLEMKNKKGSRSIVIRCTGSNA